ncbi:uncharacterized protein DEA37_0011569 [Paragonimus westermani]|uniref:CCHC-type domain-containing protein n=1 Tax=Paragonimus westermani TaxID=34504 RepID=A0A5J4NFB9_9TREM|nr:uncharacterized protein DEA37_0011569 [Paragonimus westermani]
MSDTQVEEFFAEALERLNQCGTIAKYGYCELKRQSMVEYRLEQEWERDRLNQVDLKLDAELCTLEQELSRLDTDLRSMQDMEKYWKETAKRLDVIEHESQEVLLQTEKILVHTAELDAHFRKRLLSVPKIVHSNCLLTNANVVGATELFSPWNTLMIADWEDQNKDITVAVDLSNLLTVCAVNCLSFENHTYCLRTLFGLLWFNVACNPIQSLKEKMAQSAPTIMPLDCLVVTEVECCAPPEDSRPVDCNAVEALAAYTVEFFQSRDGRSQLRSRLVGSTLESVVKHLEFIMSPYLLLGADLRAIYIAQHEVEFNAVLPMDFTLLASTQKNLVRSTPTRLVLNEHGQDKVNTSSDGSSLDRILPGGSINISVTLFNREVRAVVVLQFKLSSLDVDVSNCPATCLDVILGRIEFKLRQHGVVLVTNWSSNFVTDSSPALMLQIYIDNYCYSQNLRIKMSIICEQYEDVNNTVQSGNSSAAPVFFGPMKARPTKHSTLRLFNSALKCGSRPDSRNSSHQTTHATSRFGNFASCGKKHSRCTCIHRRSICHKCGKRGHLQSVCKSNRNRQYVETDQSEVNATGDKMESFTSTVDSSASLSHPLDSTWHET